MPYSCFRDPLFLGSVALYALNRWILKPCTSIELFHSYLNDLICIPFWVPVLVSLLRCCRLRPDTGPPAGCEVLVPLVLWSIVFEIVLPRLGPFCGLAVADPSDIFCYAAGAFVAALHWRWLYPLITPRVDAPAPRSVAEEELPAPPPPQPRSACIDPTASRCVRPVRVRLNACRMLQSNRSRRPPRAGRTSRRARREAGPREIDK
jgi:hypothetical protein